MAADQRKKRVNAASLVGCTSREQYRVNRKKLQVQQHDLKMRPNISLEWDNKKKSVVSKKEQIGITRRHLIPFIEPGTRGQNALADVFSVPREIFELENLSEVVSYEVWQSHLSDKERSFLSQFLPKELEPDAMVRDLLSGNNFHFGNPFIKWGASLCCGELHPDNVLHKEQFLKAGKKAYYSDLQKYHHDMVETLQMWKEKWAHCKDPEVDIVQNIWSSRKHAERSMPLSGTRFYGMEENLVATPESCSWANSEIAYSSDNQNLGTMHGESQRRRDFLDKISDNSSRGLKVATTVPRKGEKLHKRNIQHSDGAKYMSYIKVSREQHERVKSSMKHAGNSIQPRSLNNVLGSIDALNVQPFERFEEEERKKLHEHWIKLATNDVPEAFAKWRKSQSQRQETTRSLGEEMEQKVKHQETALNGEREGSQSKRMELLDDGEEENPPSITNEGVEKEHSIIEEQKNNEESVDEMETETEDEKETKSDYIYEGRTHDDTEMIEAEDVVDHVFVQDHNQQQIASLNNSASSIMRPSANPDFLQDQHKQQISSLNSNPHTNSMKIESRGNDVCAKTGEDPPIVPECSGNLNQVDIPVSQGVPLPSASDVWPVGDVHGSYYQSTATNAGYASGQQLSIGHQQFIQEQTVQMLDSETNRQGKDAGKDLLHRQPDDMSFFSSYPIQDRNELLQTFFKDQSNLSYHHQQKHPGLEFQTGNDLLMEAGQFPGHFREQVHPSLPLDLRQKRLNDLYMHQNIQESMYSGGRFTIPRQEDLPVNIHDWANVSSIRMPVPSQHQLSSGELGQNWYTGENGNRGGWPSLDVAVGVNHSFSSGSNTDQTLFSVLSECNELRPRASYDAMGSTDRLIQAGNYSGIGGGIPSSSNFLQQSANPLNYLSGHEAGGGIKMSNLGWMGMPQQNPGIPESIGKPFLRSWNQ
ncbi:hypothetical protein CDL12_03049 [Handroanthus impetiginosus]|uniref:DEUBAD domain-containing protein n=1 Tax=Handroanthus impetiginosus TaxID=429701 RepID=A0A2G9I386_9LAMI|nr:hypothetical protein CDL12_03049 [Handroanthus impetiginosus]